MSSVFKHKIKSEHVSYVTVNNGPFGVINNIMRSMKYERLNNRTVIQGLRAEATVAKRGDRGWTEWIVQSLCLPPDDRRAPSEVHVEDNRGRDGAV